MFITCVLMMFIGLFNHAQAQDAVNSITFQNKGTTIVKSSGLNLAGTVAPPPLLSVPAGITDAYTEAGIGQITSFHIDYTNAAGDKQCHFDSASFPATAGGCMFTKAATSKGRSFATCTATVTSVNQKTCSQSVTFTMQ